MLPHELQESGYLLGRKADERPIDNPQQIERLVRANENMRETRALLKHGRGNLRPDNLVTNGEGMVRAQTCYTIYGVGKDGLSMAAASVVLGVGNCDQHGAVNLLLQAGNLRDNEAVQTVQDEAHRHTWSQLRAPGQPNINEDTWCNGPAIEEGDGSFQPTKDSGAPVDAANGPAAKQCLIDLVESFTEEGSPQHVQLVEALAANQSAKFAQPPYGASNQAIASDFAARARFGLAAMPTLKQEILAVGVAREAYDLNVRAAAVSTEAIVQEAMRLDDLDRPAVQPLPSPPNQVDPRDQ